MRAQANVTSVSQSRSPAGQHTDRGRKHLLRPRVTRPALPFSRQPSQLQPRRGDVLVGQRSVTHRQKILPSGRARDTARPEQQQRLGPIDETQQRTNAMRPERGARLTRRHNGSSASEAAAAPAAGPDEGSTGRRHGPLP